MILGNKIDINNEKKFSDLIKKFLDGIKEYDFSKDSFCFFYDDPDSIKRTEYFSSLKDEYLQVKFSGLFDGENKLLIKSNLDKRFTLRKDQTLGDVNKNNIHSEVRLLNEFITSNIDGSRNLTLVISALPCVECSKSICSINNLIFKLKNSNISTLLISKHDLSLDNKDNFIKVINSLLDNGIKVYLFSFNNYNNEDDIEVIAALLKKEDPFTGCNMEINIEEIDYKILERFQDVKESNNEIFKLIISIIIAIGIGFIFFITKIIPDNIKTIISDHGNLIIGINISIYLIFILFLLILIYKNIEFIKKDAGFIEYNILTNLVTSGGVGMSAFFILIKENQINSAEELMVGIFCFLTIISLIFIVKGISYISKLYKK